MPALPVLSTMLMDVQTGGQTYLKEQTGEVALTPKRKCFAFSAQKAYSHSANQPVPCAPIPAPYSPQRNTTGISMVFDLTTNNAG